MVTKSTLFLLEALDVIGATTIFGTFYGIIFTLYCLCAWSLHLKIRKSDERYRARFTLGYISLLFFCATGVLALNSRMVQVAYIEHANFPGGPLDYERSFNPTTNSLFLASSSLTLLINVLTMGIQIRRLWIIWSRTRYAVVVTILPLLLLLAFIALFIPINIPANFIPLDQLAFSQKSETGMAIASYAVPAGLTAFVTGLITARLLRARRQHMKLLGVSEASSPYLSIVAILIESYLLESVWSLAAAISATPNTPSFQVFSVNDSAIKIITYFLIVYRVETGRGWTKQTAEKLTTLEWNHGTQTTTYETTGVRAQGPATTTLVTIASPPIAYSDSAA